MSRKSISPLASTLPSHLYTPSSLLLMLRIWRLLFANTANRSRKENKRSSGINQVNQDNMKNTNLKEYVLSLYNLNAHWQNICTFKRKMYAGKFGVSSFQNSLNFPKFNLDFLSTVSYLLQGVINCKVKLQFIAKWMEYSWAVTQNDKKIKGGKKTPQKLNWATYNRISNKMLFPSLDYLPLCPFYSPMFNDFQLACSPSLLLFLSSFTLGQWCISLPSNTSQKWVQRHNPKEESTLSSAKASINWNSIDILRSWRTP